MQFDNICRTCLSEEQNMKSVFDTDCSLGEALQFFQMLMDCTSIKVAEDDGLPTQICLSCIKLLARSFNFRKLCMDSDSTLREVLRKSTKTITEPMIELNPSSDCVAVCSQELRADDPDMLNIKMECEESVINTDYLPLSAIEKMMENAHDFNPLTNQSVYNEDVKPKIKDDLMHDKNDLQTNIVDEDKKSIFVMPDETEQPIYPCLECTACFTVEYDLKSHAETHHIQTGHTCTVCNKALGSAFQLTIHMRRVHNVVKKILCSKCGKTFQCASKLRRHIAAKIHTGEKPFVCTVCDRRFAHSYQMVKHARIHGEKDFTCSVCEKRLSSLGALGSHMKIHAGVKNHVCPYCGKAFTASFNLRVHELTHTGKKQYICHTCGKGFLTKYHLIKHIRTHRGDKPHICTVCGKGSGDARQLRLHMRVHTGDKPYQCNLCPKGFARSESLKHHIKTHTDERNHICVYCKKGFYQARTLQTHLRTHTGEKPYTCKICNRAFSQSGALSTHMKSH